jgi:hypothetical protein
LFPFFFLFSNVGGSRLLFPFFINFSRKEKLIDLIDGKTQRKCSGTQNKRDIDVQSKGKLIGVIDATSRRGKLRKESLCDSIKYERIIASFCQWYPRHS